MALRLAAMADRIIKDKTDVKRGEAGSPLIAYTRQLAKDPTHHLIDLSV